MSGFSKNLKYYRKSKKLNQTQLAGLIGVKQTTIANYESGKRTPTIELLTKIGTVLEVSMDRLLGKEILVEADKEIFSNKASLNARIFEMLINNQEDEVFRMIKLLRDEGKTLDYIFEEVIAPVMEQVGLLWESGEVSITTEHRTSEFMVRMVEWLATNGHSSEKNGEKVVCMSVSADQHTLGMRMIAVILERKGYQTAYLGNNLPTASLIDLLVKEDVALLLVSVTMRYHLDALMNMVSCIRQNDDLKAIKIVIGGQGSLLDTIEGLEIDGQCSTIQELETWLTKNND